MTTCKKEKKAFISYYEFFEKLIQGPELQSNRMITLLMQMESLIIMLKKV